MVFKDDSGPISVSFLVCHNSKILSRVVPWSMEKFTTCGRWYKRTTKYKTINKRRINSFWNLGNIFLNIDNGLNNFVDLFIG